MNYFENVWNWYFSLSQFLNIYVVLEHVYSFSDFHYDRMVNTGAVAVSIQWFAIYYWVRMVPELAFFVTYLAEVIHEIKAFVIMFIICILTFGNAVYIIDKAN